MNAVLHKMIEHVPPTIREVDRSFFVFCNYMFVFAFFAHIIFVPIFYQMGNEVVFINNILAVFLDALCLRLNHKGYIKVATSIWITEITLHSLYCMVAFGWEHGYYYYLLSMVIIVFFSRWPLFIRLIATLILCTATIVMFWYTHTHPPITELNEKTLISMHAYNAIANFVGIAYASFYYRRYSEQMANQLLHLAHTDALTGICNRRSFEQSAERELAQHASEGIDCAFLLLDIDHFKSINDTFGHAAGDIALQKVAGICRQTLRERDILGRIGGEEFAILLSHAAYAEALQIAERLRGTLKASRLILDDGTEVHLSVSIGLTIPRSPQEKLSDLMMRSDHALYQAKHEGRNRVVAIM